jgi:hypothetical protein
LSIRQERRDFLLRDLVDAAAIVRSAPDAWKHALDVLGSMMPAGADLTSHRRAPTF